MSIGVPSEASDSTSRTLLERIRCQDPDAWRRFVHLYGPVVYAWGQRAGLQSHDASDVAQEVFQLVASNIGRFRRDRPGDSFRGWLRTITSNKIRDHFQKQRQQIASHEAIDEVPAPDPATLDHQPNADSDLARRALELIQTDFEPSTWQAFLACTVSGLTVAAVHKAKYRVLHRLRYELEGLIE